VYNGDDSISFKANSTDITLTNSHFYNGLGVAIGSIGQLKDQFETVERVKVENIVYENTLHAVGDPLSSAFLWISLTKHRSTSKPGPTTRTATRLTAAAAASAVRPLPNG
jgi:hypothetical protein